MKKVLPVLVLIGLLSSTMLAAAPDEESHVFVIKDGENADLARVLSELHLSQDDSLKVLKIIINREETDGELVTSKVREVVLNIGTEELNVDDILSQLGLEGSEDSDTEKAYSIEVQILNDTGDLNFPASGQQQSMIKHSGDHMSNGITGRKMVFISDDGEEIHLGEDKIMQLETFPADDEDELIWLGDDEQFGNEMILDIEEADGLKVIKIQKQMGEDGYISCNPTGCQPDNCAGKTKRTRNPSAGKNSTRCVPATDCCPSSNRKYDRRSNYRKGHGLGFGGLGLELNFLDFDFAGINEFIEALGFNPIDDEGVAYLGIRGYRSIGHGWYLGAIGAGFTHNQETIVGSTPRHLSASNGYAGALLVKRYPIRPDITFEGGIMLGGGAASIEVADVRENPTFVDPEDNFNEMDQFKFERTYLAFQPEASLLIHLNRWLGIRGSVSFLGTYGGEWESVPFGNIVEGDAPDVPGGLNLTLGAWIGH